METEEGSEGRKRRSALRIRVIAFIILSVATIIFLTLLGASPILILEVFGLGGILAVSAIVIVIVLSGIPHPFRKRP